MKIYQALAILIGVFCGLLFVILLSVYFAFIGGQREIMKFAEVVNKVDILSFVIFTTLHSIFGAIICRDSRSFEGIITASIIGITIGIFFKIIAYSYSPTTQVEENILSANIGCYRASIGAILCLPAGAVGSAITNNTIRRYGEKDKRRLFQPKWFVDKKDRVQTFSSMLLEKMSSSVGIRDGKGMS